MGLVADGGTVAWDECWGPVASNRELIEEPVAPWLRGSNPQIVDGW